MANVLFTNVRILDATGAQPYVGEVLVQGNRIARVGRGPRSLPQSGTTVIDGAGATLMPGMVEAHTHFGWTNSTTKSTRSGRRRWQSNTSTVAGPLASAPRRRSRDSTA